MKISLFAVVAAVVAVAVASPVPISSQSVDSPSLKTANVPAILPEDLIAKGDVTGLVKRGNSGRTWINSSPFYSVRAWRGGLVVGQALASNFQKQFLQNWDRNHELLSGFWSWSTKITMSNGITSTVVVHIENNYEVSAEKVGEMVYYAALYAANQYCDAKFDVFDGGDNSSRAWGKVIFHEY
ncbi:hypothetical protein BGZ91_008983 [Linnemannia elongata]|nr:hypothetical protein BGZ91_008983 [Linnemannia elongata]KAG0044348.1 hypothetical protein BGZ90_008795 [Linnemannia elongata]